LQTIAAKQQREATANAINADIARRANLAPLHTLRGNFSCN